MTPDRDETLLREALTAGLHPAETDLWPAVAEALPDAPKHPARRVRTLRLVVCIGAPLLVAAGALLGQVKFTNLRTDPRPSFAPDKNTGYAIQYDQTAYALPDELMESLQAHYNGQPDADGVPPMHISTSGFNVFTTGGPGGRGYDSWADLTKATGLPLLQNDLLDSSTPDSAIYLSPDLKEELRLPDDWNEQSIEEHNAFYDAYYDELWRLAGQWPAGFTVSWSGTSDYQMAPDILFCRRKDKLDNGYTVETISQTALATIDRPAGTTDTQHNIYFEQSSGYTWDVEEYTTPSGIVALLPRCTSNKGPSLSSYAYFEQDGIYYTVFLYPDEGWGPDTRDKTEEARAMLKEVLDSFAPAA